METNFIYDADRPFEVRLQNVTGGDVVFDRDLMSEALAQPGRCAGQGWVRLLQNGENFLVNLLFLSTDGSSNPIEYPAHEVKVFMQKVFDAVPFGSESMDVDALLQDFYDDKI